MCAAVLIVFHVDVVLSENQSVRNHRECSTRAVGGHVWHSGLVFRNEYVPNVVWNFLNHLFKFRRGLYWYHGLFQKTDVNVLRSSHPQACTSGGNFHNR